MLIRLTWWLLTLYLRLFWPILVLIRRLWDSLVNVLMRFTVGLRRKAVLPPVFNPLLLLPATTLAYNIRHRKMTSVEVVRAFVTRCGDMNPILNAIVQENFEHALLTARLIDERINSGFNDKTLTPEKLEKEEPFLGVPFTVNETIKVAGFPNTAGLLRRQDEIATYDATIVDRLREAGAILLATTNVPEMGMWWECSNPLYGKTNNPYDTRRTPGGASGGEAALMCSCGSPLSVGTDTGGSIRTPSFFCGLFGHKPTTGIIPLVGCDIRKCVATDDCIQVAGHIVRHAVDIAPVLSVLAGPERHIFELSKPVHLSSLKFYYVEDDDNKVLTSPVVKPLKRIQNEIVKYMLSTYDLDVVKVRIPELKNSYWIWREKLQEDFPEVGPMYKQLVNNQGEINIWTETLRGLLGRQRHSCASLFQVALEKCVDELKFLRDQKKLFEGSQKTSKEVYNPGWRKLKMKIQRLLGEEGVLFFPTHPTLAPYQRESYLKPMNFVYAAVFNALGFPVTQVPLGIDQDSGLPLGIQVVGGMYMDRLTIAVAQELELAFGGWKCPAKVL